MLDLGHGPQARRPAARRSQPLTGFVLPGLVTAAIVLTASQARAGAADAATAREIFRTNGAMDGAALACERYLPTEPLPFPAGRSASAFQLLFRRSLEWSASHGIPAAMLETLKETYQTSFADGDAEITARKNDPVTLRSVCIPYLDRARDRARSISDNALPAYPYLDEILR